MPIDALPLYDLPGAPADAGYAHGVRLRALLAPPFVDRYLATMGAITRTTPDDLAAQAERWLDTLPDHYQLEIDGMAAGARVPAPRVAEFLYADIARPSDAAATPAEHAVLAGPMCSAATVTRDDAVWVARNCDWLFATLLRGTAAVVHRTPGRIPVLAVGIRGDIDVDTGINAERLWLHLHTMPALDDPPRDRTCISWLFWAREALETCATLDDLECFIAGTTRDRGVMVVAADGKTGDAAVFECGRAAHRRVDQGGPWLAATNHTLAKEVGPERLRTARRGSTVARLGALRDRLDAGPFRRMPDALFDVLADSEVEMRNPTHLRTIYAAVARPATGEIWFAAGDADGRPAASAGGWSKVPAVF